MSLALQEILWKYNALYQVHPTEEAPGGGGGGDSGAGAGTGSGGDSSSGGGDGGRREAGQQRGSAGGSERGTFCLPKPAAEALLQGAVPGLEQQVGWGVRESGRPRCATYATRLERRAGLESWLGWAPCRAYS